MTSSETKKLYDLLHDFKTDVKAELKAHTTILDEVIRPDIAGIKNHLATQNSRIAKAEKAIDDRDRICGAIQVDKENEKVKREKIGSNLKWYATTAILAVGVTVGVYSAFTPKKTETPMMLLKQVNDSLVVISPINVRGEGNRIDTVNSMYFDLKMK